MRNSLVRASALVAVLCAPATAIAAGGSYICAISEVFECQPVQGCKEVSTNTINLAEFIVIDVDKKTMTGASIGDKPQSEDVEGLTETDKNIFLYGTQDVETWNATISLETGALTGGIASSPSSFALFGNCTKK